MYGTHQCLHTLRWISGLEDARWALENTTALNSPWVTDTHTWTSTCVSVDLLSVTWLPDALGPQNHNVCLHAQCTSCAAPLCSMCAGGAAAAAGRTDTRYYSGSHVGGEKTINRHNNNTSSSGGSVTCSRSVAPSRALGLWLWPTRCICVQRTKKQSEWN